MEPSLVAMEEKREYIPFNGKRLELFTLYKSLSNNSMDMRY
jgi:hypothetical protein